MKQVREGEWIRDKESEKDRWRWAEVGLRHEGLSETRRGKEREGQGNYYRSFTIRIWEDESHTGRQLMNPFIG